jgi:hypothetical protein
MKKVCLFLFLFLSASVLGASPYSHYQVIVERDIFRPLWNLRAGAVEDESQKSLAAARIRQEEEKKQKEQKEQEEKQLLEAKRSELEQSFELTGVVFNGRSLYALITDRRVNRSSGYSEGDTLAGARITQIDEKSQTVVLDYENKLTIKLKLAK